MYVDKANKMDRENNHENITLLEPIFEELYRFAQDHDCTEQFVKIVNGNIDAPWEMLTYCAHYVWFSIRPAPVKNSRTKAAGDPDIFPRSVLDTPPVFSFQLPSTPSVPSCPPVGKWAGLTLC